MSKSNYPDKIDTSVELPTVRDNITEIGGDALNSFKSAILAIEKTLGINPQGATGNTVATRIGRSLDLDGNILPSAFTQAGLISGPITDNEVSENASISERKLDLNFPTQLLQDQISMLQSDIESFDEALTEIAAKFAAHVSPSALNRHSAVSISVASATSVASSVATLDMEANSLQDALEEIYNSHINYDGLNISSTNNSHSANQVFFDNTEIQDITTSDSVQDAIEDIANISSVGLVNSILNLNSNGVIRRGSVTDEFENNDRATLLVESSTVTYTLSQGSSRTTIVFSDTPTPIRTISPFDIFTLSGSVNTIDNKDYRISDITLDGSGNLISIEIFGGPGIDASGSLTAEIYKNPYKIYNPAGLISAVRPRNDKTNTPDIQISNPNSATILSSQISPEAITASAHTFDIVIDDGSAVTIETYDSNLSVQTIDSIVNKINEQSVDNRYNFLAYKYRANNCYELAIIHNIPNMSGDTKNRTLTISAGSSNDGTSFLGFDDILDQKTEGTSGNSVLINGSISSIFGKFQTLTGSSLEIVAGTQGLTLITQTFSEAEIRVGDLIIIEGSTDSADDGTYRIDSILNDTAEVDGSYPFAGSLDENSTVYVSRTTAPIGELTFTEIISANGSILFDTFLDEELDIFYTKRLEVDGDPRSGSFIASVIDISKGFILDGQTGSLDINLDGTAFVTGPDGNPGEAKFIASPGDYKLFAADGFSFLTIRTGTVGLPSSAISLTLYGFNEIARGSFRLSRGIFSTTLGRVLGYPIESGVPAVIDKKRTGTIDETIVSESLLEKYIQGPRNDLRASGVIRGLEVSNIQLFSGYQTYDVGAGVAIVNGIRIEYPGRLDNQINTENNFYVALDSIGCIVAGESIANPDGYTIDNQGELSPFYDDDVAHLASIEDQVYYDLRLFVDRIDLKFIKDIVVSNQAHFGHFSDINSAVSYAKRFSDMFPDAGTPSIHIREGEYFVSSVIIIDFDVTIYGSGRTTVITKTGALAEGSELQNGGNPDPLSSVFYIGNISSNQSDDIIHGVTIKDMTYKTSDSLINVGSFITLAEAEHPSGIATYNIENILAIGPSTMEYGTGLDNSIIGEYFLVFGFADISTYAPVADTYSNLFIKDCFFNSIGIEYGPCHMRDDASNTFKNVIASHNIGTSLSPNEGIVDFEVFEVISSATLSNFIEVSNVIDSA